MKAQVLALLVPAFFVGLCLLAQIRVRVCHLVGPVSTDRLVRPEN